MQQLPKPALGEITAITITTKDLEASLAYYRMLGFSEVMRADWPFPWIQVSDGVLLIMLRKDPKPYLALTYYVKGIDKVVAALEKKGVPFLQKAAKTDMLKRYLLASPDGLNISLVSMVDGFRQPPGPGMLHMSPEDYTRPGTYVNKTCGLYGELAHPVKDIDKSIAFWELLGFKALSRRDAPYPWAIMSDGLAIIGLHQATHFAYPAITFFAADMGSKITTLKKAGLKDFTEKGPVDIVLNTPEQQHIFLFGMGGAQPERKRPVIDMEEIETERMILKAITPENSKQIFTECNDKEIMSYLGLTTPAELEVERYKYEHGKTTYRMSFRTFLLTDKQTGRPLGKCGFHNWYAMHNRSEVGYHMNSDADKNKGYMKEAFAAVIAYGFEHMGLNRIEAFVGPTNEPSMRLVKGLGFTQEGLLRQHYNKDGDLQDSAVFGLLKQEYMPAKKKKGKK